jgi:hypothetical protein
MDGDWYVARDGEMFGPFTFDRMRRGARDGELQGSDPVWSSASPEWRPAGDVPGLWELPPRPAASRLPSIQGGVGEQPRAASQAVSPGAVAGDAATDRESDSEPRPGPEARPKAGVVLRHWRGELTLVQAYWGVCFLLSILVVWASKLFGDWLGKADLPPQGVGLVLIVFLMFLCAMSAWQLVGTWRAAGNHIRTTGRRVWAVVARVAVVVSALGSLGQFKDVTWPMLSESAQLMIGRDDTPAYRVELLHGGTEVELAGGMPFGTSKALRKVLDGAPGVKVLHLNSGGGRIGEGFLIYRMVRERNLTTYTATECASACTVAFLGGSERYLSSKARLGFHSSSFGSLDGRQHPDMNADMRSLLAEHGVPGWFIDRALSTSARSMWYPPHSELISANIVTLVVEPGKFGESGRPVWRDKEAIQRDLLSVPFYAMVRDSDPAAFDRISERAAAAIDLGRTQPEVIQQIEEVFATEVLPKYLSVAPDAAIQRYWRAQLAEMTYLSRDPASCVAFAFPELRRADLDLLKAIPPELIDEDTAALTEVVRQAIRAPWRQPPDNLDEELVGVFTRINARMPVTQEILANPGRYLDDPRAVCEATVAFYTDILSLPPARSGALLRSFAQPQR